MTPKQFTTVTEWQKATFGEATSLSKLSHLQQEVKELFDSICLYEDGEPNIDDVRMEFADCFILLYGAASSFGLSLFEINKAIGDKMTINKQRKWGKPDANGVVNHIKE